MSCAGAVGATCAVCGDRATRLRYSHYGAVSCFSCRAFFRRAVEKGSHTGYACAAKVGGCLVTVDTRKKCPRCRFDKCVDVGMRHGGCGKKKKEEEEDVTPMAVDTVEKKDDDERLLAPEYDDGEIAEFPRIVCLDGTEERTGRDG